MVGLDFGQWWSARIGVDILSNSLAGLLGCLYFVFRSRINFVLIRVFTILLISDVRIYFIFDLRNRQEGRRGGTSWD